MPIPIIVAPKPLPIPKPDEFYVFLAGSIENGKAADWQSEIHAILQDSPELKDKPITLINPRRPQWDSNWDQDHPELGKQIQWELQGIQQSHVVLFYFDEPTLSPITLAELGFCVGRHGQVQQSKSTVYCPEKFWRRRNVEELCALGQFPCYQDKSAWLQSVVKMLEAV